MEVLGMNRFTVTAKGQITLRQELLRHLGVHPGEEISAEKLPNGRIEIRAAQPAGQISDIFNVLRKTGGVSLGIEEIEQLAAKGWARKQ